MRRIDKERDRLLRRLARAGSLTGALLALACLVVPGALDPGRFALAVALDLLVIVLAVLATSRTALLPILGTIVVAVAFMLVIGVDATIDPAASTANRPPPPSGSRLDCQPRSKRWLSSAGVR